MNKYARDMLMRRRDMRNPYGSRGGYVVSDKAMNDMARGRDYADYSDYARGGRGGNDYADYADYARGGRGGHRDYAYSSEYDSRQDYRDYARGDYARYGRDYEQDGQYGNDGGYGYGIGMFDYNTQDYGYGRDGANKLSRREIKKWEKELEGADGTKGPKWQVEQIKPIAQQQGIKFDEYSPELFAVVMNALYSDYCKVLGADPIMYAKLTKAWLEDDDFDGEPEEKAMLYYKCIVSKGD